MRDLPRRQPAHQALRVLGVADRVRARDGSRRALPRGGVHAPACDGAAREDRLHAVVHVLHVAQREVGARGVLPRADATRRTSTTSARTCGRTHPTSSTRPCRRATRATFIVRFVLAAGLERELRHLRSGVRAAGTHAARSRQRGVPRLREVRGAPLGPRAARQPAPPDRPGERDPPRAPGAAARRHAAVPRRRQRSHRLLEQARPAPTARRRRAVRRQPRSGAHAVGVDRARPRRARLRSGRAHRRPRPADGESLRLGRSAQLRRARPRDRARARLLGHGSDGA